MVKNPSLQSSVSVAFYSVRDMIRKLLKLTRAPPRVCARDGACERQRRRLSYKSISANYTFINSGYSLAVLAHSLGLGLVRSVSHLANDLVQLGRHVCGRRAGLVKGLKRQIIDEFEIRVVISSFCALFRLSDRWTK